MLAHANDDEEMAMAMADWQWWTKVNATSFARLWRRQDLIYFNDFRIPKYMKAHSLSACLKNVWVRMCVCVRSFLHSPWEEGFECFHFRWCDGQTIAKHSCDGTSSSSSLPSSSSAYEPPYLIVSYCGVCFVYSPFKSCVSHFSPHRPPRKKAANKDNTERKADSLSHHGRRQGMAGRNAGNFHLMVCNDFRTTLRGGCL